MPFTNFYIFLSLIFELLLISILVTCTVEVKILFSFLHSSFIYFLTLFLSFRCFSIFNLQFFLFAQFFLIVLCLLSIINIFPRSIFPLL